MEVDGVDIPTGSSTTFDKDFLVAFRKALGVKL